MKKIKFKFHQYIVVEFHNCAPFIYRVESNKKITVSKVVHYFEVTEGWSEERDNIIFIDKPTKIHI